MREIRITDFSGGLNTYFSPHDIKENQFQKFADIDNRKLGRLEKAKGQSNVSGQDSITETVSRIPQGFGFFTYRTEYDDAGTPAINPKFWWLCYFYYNTKWYLKRHDSADGDSGSWATILTQGAGGDWTGTSSAAVVDMYVVNSILRISDGEFSNSHISKWYGHIKRDIWGQGVTYNTSDKFKQPSQTSAVNTWTLKDQTLTPPTLVAMSSPFDGGDSVDASNEVGLYVHFPGDSTGDYKVMDDVETDTFYGEDRYSISFVYDFVQESALAKDSDDVVGVRAADWTSTDKKRVPVINTVLNTSSWNNRITAINIYWKPQFISSVENSEWFLIGTLDIDNGWIKDPRGKAVSEYTSTPFTALNMGAWIPVPDVANIRNIKGGNDGSIIAVGSDDISWKITTTLNISGVVQANDICWGGTNSNEVNSLKLTDTLIGLVNSVAGTDTIGFSPRPITYRAETDATPRTDTSGSGTRYAFCAAIDSNKIATWYMPNDGIKLATYQSKTGRLPDEDIDPVRWKTSCVTENGTVFIGNVDTLDENDQTVRESSRLMWTIPGHPDSFNITRSRDFGKDDGDKIVALEYWNGRVFIFKDRSTYVYNVSTGQFFIEKHYFGYGCKFRHSVTITPYGIVTCDASRIILHSGGEPQELSYMWRKTSTTGLDSYQDLTFSNPVLGYSPNTNELYFVNDTSEDDAVLYKYNFDLKSWSKQTMDDNMILSNFRMGENMEPLAAFHELGVTDMVRIKEFNSGSDSAATATVKSKKYDTDDPNRTKLLKRVYCTYKTDDATDTGEDLDLGGPLLINQTSVQNFSTDDSIFSEGDYIKIDDEIILIKTMSAGAVSEIERGIAGTVDVQHAGAPSIYQSIKNLTVKLFFDGATAADETLTFNAIESLINVGQDKDDFTGNKQFKTIEVQLECSGDKLVIEDLLIHYELMGVKT